LILDKCKCSSLTKGVKEKIETFPNLEVLTMNGVGLNSLANFPSNKSLKMLELSDNKISGGLENLVGLTNLVSINISGNLLASFDTLAPLAKLTEIVSIDMFGNPITEKAD
jgi:Leucine-rich repeat (LRR) protein